MTGMAMVIGVLLVVDLLVALVVLSTLRWGSPPLAVTVSGGQR